MLLAITVICLWVNVTKADTDWCYENGNASNRAIEDINKAINDINKAIEVKPDDAMAYYNFACFFSKMKKGNQACDWLKKSINKGIGYREYIISDPDLDNIRNEPCYQEIMQDKK